MIAALVRLRLLGMHPTWVEFVASSHFTDNDVVDIARRMEVEGMGPRYARARARPAQEES